MAQLLVVILYDTGHLPELVAAWQDIGVPGVTILKSAGGYRSMNWLQQVGLGAIGDLFNIKDVQSKTLLAAIEDDEILEQAIIEAERIVGDFSEPEKGILIVIPAGRTLGVVTPKAEDKEVVQPLSPQDLDVMVEMRRVTRDTPVAVIDKILNLKPVIVQTNQLLIEVAETMVNAPNVHVACVVNARRRLVGLLRLQTLAEDLLMAVVPEELLRETHELENTLHFAQLSRTHTAGDAMIPAVWVKEEDTLKEAFHKMHQNQLPGIPLVNERYEVKGYINLLELLAIYTRSQKTAEG